MMVEALEDELCVVFLVPQDQVALLESISKKSQELKDISDRFESQIYPKIKEMHHTLTRELQGTDKDPYFHRCQYFDALTSFLAPISLLFWSKITAKEMRDFLNRFEVKGDWQIRTALHLSNQDNLKLHDQADAVRHKLRELIKLMIVATYSCREMIADPVNLSRDSAAGELSKEELTESSKKNNGEPENDLYRLISHTGTKELVKIGVKKVASLLETAFFAWLK